MLLDGVDESLDKETAQRNVSLSSAWTGLSDLGIRIPKDLIRNAGNNRHRKVTNEKSLGLIGSPRAGKFAEAGT